jgi:hypothetical protein
MPSVLMVLSSCLDIRTALNAMTAAYEAGESMREWFVRFIEL